MFYIYILHSEDSGAYYTGFTEDVHRRVWEHNNSTHTTFTSKNRPWVLVAAFSVSCDMGIALKAERFIKKQKSRAFIEKIYSMDKIDLPMAQLVIPYVRDAHAGLIRGSSREHSDPGSGRGSKKKPAFPAFFLYTMYYIYILHSEDSGAYYTGFTEDVQRRVWEHNNSTHTTYTSKNRPWVLVAAFSVSCDMGIALKAERFIKKQKSRAFIEKICSMDKIDLPMAQLVNPVRTGRTCGMNQRVVPGAERSGIWQGELQEQPLTFNCEWLF